MANCDMCGLKTEKLNSIKIEGTIMKVCDGCTKFGEVMNNKSLYNSKKFKHNRREEVEEVLVQNYSQKIKSARESKNLKQAELAKELNEKESLIHQIESGHFRPRLVTAKKIEKFFGINLIEKVKEIQIQKEEKNDEGLTIGDLIKKKLKN